ncbi:hypothetical protein VPH35_121373 [Triticum aestivum]
MAESMKETLAGGVGGGDASGNGGGGDAVPPFESNLESKFEGLNLCGEEEEELDLSGEVEGLLEETRWLGVFRVHTQRPFSHVALFKDMRNASASAQDVIYKAKGDNRFIVQFMCLGDWNRVMNGGPWLFRREAVVIEEYDGLTDVYEYKIDRIPVCARTKGIPDVIMQKSALSEKVANKVGVRPIKVFVTAGRINMAQYLRARVFVKLDTPLVRFVPLTLKEMKRYPVEYEKLPKFCNFCGLIGHEVTECGDGIHTPESCEWGEWLLVLFDNGGGRGNNNIPRGRGNMGRGGGRGGGRGNPGDPNEQEAADMHLGDTIIPTARKRLIGQDGTPVSTSSTGHVTEKVLLIENNSKRVVDKSQLITPQKIHDNKRLRAGTEMENQHGSSSSATSFEEDRRNQ